MSGCTDLKEDKTIRQVVVAVYMLNLSVTAIELFYFYCQLRINCSRHAFCCSSELVQVHSDGLATVEWKLLSRAVHLCTSRFLQKTYLTMSQLLRKEICAARNREFSCTWNHSWKRAVQGHFCLLPQSRVVMMRTCDLKCLRVHLKCLWVNKPSVVHFY